MFNKKFLIISFLAVIFFGCNETSDNSVSPIKGDNQGELITSYTVTASDFQFFGDLHNDGLDYIFDNFIIDVDFSTITEEQFHSVLMSTTDYYFNNVNDITKDATDDITTSTYPAIDDQTATENLSSAQITIYYAIKAVLNSNYTPAQALAALNDIDNDIETILVPDDRCIMWAANAVAKKSIEYWSGDNAQKWNDVLEDNNFPAINWKNVAYADYSAFVGAAGAAIISGGWRMAAAEAAIIAGLNSGGIAAVPGAIIGAVGSVAVQAAGAAVIASAGELGWQLI